MERCAATSSMKSKSQRMSDTETKDTMRYQRGLITVGTSLEFIFPIIIIAVISVGKVRKPSKNSDANLGHV